MRSKELEGTCAGNGDTLNVVGDDGMEVETLHVQMLGKFAMYYGKNPVSLNKMSSAKSVRLLQTLLLSGAEGIAKSELIDSLYGWSEQSDASNRNKNLNNLLYRLRGQMAASGLPEDEYIVIRDGICCWNNKIPVELDAELFRSTIIQAEKSEGQERLRLYQKANACYHGELLPMNQSEMWFYEKSIYYKELYIRTIRVLERAYRESGNYKDLTDLYIRAAAIYPFDNWQTELIRCYLETYRYEDAMNIYNETMELYAREMGNPPTDEMQRCFETLELQDKNHRQGIKNVSSWQTLKQDFLGKEGNVLKAIFGDTKESGAYYCTYPSFVDYCRLVVRARERYEIRAVLVFLTLTRYEKKGMAHADSLAAQMEILKHAIAGSLRRGDAYTRYGNRHYILMLTNIDKPLCGMVFSRIEAKFQKMPGSRGELWYHAAMTQDLENGITDFEDQE